MNGILWNTAFFIFTIKLIWPQNHHSNHDLEKYTMHILSMKSADVTAKAEWMDSMNRKLPKVALTKWKKIAQMNVVPFLNICNINQICLYKCGGGWKKSTKSENQMAMNEQCIHWVYFISFFWISWKILFLSKCTTIYLTCFRKKLLNQNVQQN